MNPRACPLLLALSLLCLGPSARMQAGVVEGHLVLDTVEVTGRYESQIVLIEDTGSDESCQPLEIRCAPGIPCTVPQGAYWITLRSEKLVALGVTKLLAEDPDSTKRVHRFFMRVALSSWLEVPKGRFAPGDRLDALDIGSGAIFQEPVGAAATRVQVPARPIVVALVDASLNAKGIILPFTPGPDASQPLPAVSRLPAGRGQLLCVIVLPDFADPDSLSLAFRAGGRRIPPDLEVKSYPSHHYAFWFDVPSGSGDIEVDSKEWTSEQPLKAIIPDRGAWLFSEVPLVARRR